ncbi:transposase [Flavobacterium sp. P21]|uniref:transposase n=1 Tax=Flavobacterium sp. P21 TaxID=3423948 RepID=UPI003D669D21
MSQKFRNKYRISSARLQNWDYGANGSYFITICTQNREHFFGEIVETRLIASKLGMLAEKYWLEIPEHFPYVELGNFVIMPNHVHGILIIDENASVFEPVETRLIASLQLIASLPMPMPETTNKTGGFAKDKNPMFQDNISRIIRWYKGRCSFEMRKLHADFGWQSRFHDHIIRNEKSFETIQNYIENNPMNWNEDKFCDK